MLIHETYILLCIIDICYGDSGIGALILIQLLFLHTVEVKAVNTAPQVFRKDSHVLRVQLQTYGLVEASR